MSSRNVLIAGYSPGLGSELVKRFSAGGDRVITASRSGNVDHRCDLSQEGDVAALFERIEADHGSVDVVIHNAMNFVRQDFLSTTPAQFEAAWRSTLLSAVVVSQRALPAMRAKGTGVLLFSGASGSLRAGPQFSAFSAAKFALRGLSQALAREYAPDGVHVLHTVIDGLIWTDKTQQRFANAQEARSIAPQDLAELYWQLVQQPRSAWSQEVDVRPQGGSF